MQTREAAPAAPAARAPQRTGATALARRDGTTRRLGRGWSRGIRRLRESGLVPALLVAAASVLIAVVEYNAPKLPLVALLVPMVVASQVLAPRVLPWLVVFVLGVLALVVSAKPDLMTEQRVGGVVVIFVIGLVILLASFRRTTLGVAGVRGESMLVDLRDRIHHQARMPRLPEGWYAEAVMRSAGGSSFAGDFIVASRTGGGRLLQVAVVDVSGKGEQAGSRSLLLSGAFGGLLGALPPSGFLPAANDYLVRQDWSEGFATAVHVCVDLVTGEVEVRSAGHPPAVQLRAGSGRWVLHEARGPVLGLMDDAEFTVVRDTLRPGDTLLLYTDGLVETPQRDISLGIDRLLGQGTRVLRAGAESAATRIVEAAGAANDDRALLLLHRR